MNAFRYQAIEANGTAVKGVIEAEDRKGALQLLGKRGLFPSSLEICSSAAAGNGEALAPVLHAVTAASAIGRGGCRCAVRP